MCEHLENWATIIKGEYKCQKCVDLGDTWVHLRVCQNCGEVNCCDNSKNKHAKKHFQATHHPVIISAEKGEHWAWCYLDKEFVEY